MNGTCLRPPLPHTPINQAQPSRTELCIMQYFTAERGSKSSKCGH